MGEPLVPQKFPFAQDAQAAHIGGALQALGEQTVLQRESQPVEMRTRSRHMLHRLRVKYFRVDQAYCATF